MLTIRGFVRALFGGAALSLAFTALGGCQDGTFPCGTGTCDLATQICIKGADECSTCAARPAACDTDATCGCLPPANDASWGEFQCIDEGTCAEAEGGLVLTCAAPKWSCG